MTRWRAPRGTGILGVWLLLGGCVLVGTSRMRGFRRAGSLGWGSGSITVGHGVMPGVLLRVTRLCRRGVLANVRFAVGFRDCIIGGASDIRVMGIMGYVSITLCSSSLWAPVTVTLCGVARGGGCNKVSIRWERSVSNRLPFWVWLARSVSAVSSSVNARKCWCGVSVGSWQCCGKSSAEPEMR